MSRLAKARMAVFLGAAGVLAAAPSPGAPFGFSWPPGRDALAAGSSVSLAWSLPAGHDDAFGEMELVLSLDGGRTFPIRVTRDLSPATRSLAWRVPALSSARARLGLRVGDGDAPADEQILIVTEEFAIQVDASSRIEPTAFVRGEWRTLEALDSGQSTPPPDPSLLEDTGSGLAAAGRPARALAPRQRPAVAAERLTPRVGAFEVVVRPDGPVPLIGLPRIPANTPRRQ